MKILRKSLVQKTMLQKNVCFFKDNIIYLFANFQAHKDVYSISDFEYYEVIEYAEHIHIL